jgi:hypothetical protein
MAISDREKVPLERDWIIERVLMPLVPGEWREIFIGDLVEEARRFVLPARGPDAARRWLRWQIFRSLPGLLLYQSTKEQGTKEAPRFGRRVFFAALLVGFWTLQAWDSRVHHATPFVIGLVIASLILAVSTSLFGRRSVNWLLMSLAAPFLLIAARILAPAIHSDLLAIIPALTFFPLWFTGWLPVPHGTTRCA